MAAAVALIIDQAAEIDEVFLTGGALFQFDVPPFIDEGLPSLGGCHAGQYRMNREVGQLLLHMIGAITRAAPINVQPSHSAVYIISTRFNMRSVSSVNQCDGTRFWPKSQSAHAFQIDSGV